MATEAELEFLKSQEYYSLVVLEDGTICGLSRLMFTTALYIGLNGCGGWERRYCYLKEQQALKALGYLKTGDDEPAMGYVARWNG